MPLIEMNAHNQTGIPAVVVRLREREGWLSTDYFPCEGSLSLWKYRETVSGHYINQEPGSTILMELLVKAVTQTSQTLPYGDNHDCNIKNDIEWFKCVSQRWDESTCGPHHGGWTRYTLKVPFHSNHSKIIWSLQLHTYSGDVHFSREQMVI